MLAIQKPSVKSPECTPNLLPARLNHNGPVNATERYWSPETTESGETTAFFRGRKLKGRSVKIPEGYKGVVLDITDKAAPQPKKEQVKENADDEGDNDDDDEPAEVNAVEELASFEEIVVWGHEAIPADTEDPYAKGVQEWIGFAEAMHCEDDTTAKLQTS
ncbi:ribonuclease H1 small subunit [Mytilinidion resinicola]|uniref:Ribonuclease H1 small subunit n=1 Tax=Mytilinidion resinicola TaxID=574789 RepID=A0A6A6YX96_9PEZI|nr:ribonuclease H1 small subunit [Mytilinidion resinicola]KAF2813033.1 ribonuclease H1 small subunit [Mytilinidion resinicola]